MKQSVQKDFFVSYNKADRLWAEWIAWQLEEEGYSTILQAWDFRPGSNFILEMDRAAADAKRTIAVLSPDYLSAQYTQPEWAAALAQDPTGERGTLLPVQVKKCDPVGLLPQIIYVDLVELDEHEAKNRLLSEVRKERAKPPIKPSYPSIHRPETRQPRFPTSLPPIWNAPNRNLNFTGRDEILSGLRKQLREDRYTAVTQAISGLGGIGKTQIAIEYAYRFSHDYDVVWWMRSEEPATLAADYAKLAWKLALPEKDAADQMVTVDAVRSWLGRSTNWLLIFDNAGDQSDIRNYLPQGGFGHVLITSRNQNWRGTAKPLSVSVLVRSEAVAFILKRTGQEDDRLASSLAEALGDLPLALEQAGAFIEARGTSLSHYLELFTQHKNALLSRGKPSTDYPATVATTWEISFDQVQKGSLAGADLMSLCAFLAPDEIPRKLLRDGKQYLPGKFASAVNDPFVLDDAFEALRCYSLADVTDESLSIHRLVQAVTQDRMSVDAKRTTVEAALTLVNEAFPGDSDDVRTWPVCKTLLSHALTVTRHAEDLDLVSNVAGRLLNQVGVYLRVRAEFAEATAVFKKALEFDEAAYGSNHPTVATRINNLGEVLETIGDFLGAEEKYQQALTINQSAYGSDHPSVAININNLGSVFKKLADSSAIFSQDDAEELRYLIKVAELNKPSRQSGTTNLVSIDGSPPIPPPPDSKAYYAVTMLLKAEEHFKQALRINQSIYGPDHPTIANNLNNLGNVWIALGEAAKARKDFERALAINESFYGSEHPTVASISNSLGSVLKRLGDLEGARLQYERALKIDEMVYGSNHPLVALRINNIGNVWQELGDVDKARELYTQSLRIFQDSLGNQHPYTLTVQNNLRSLI